MGNGQSVEAPPRPPNKLSKPKTNNSNSTTNLLNLKIAGPSSRRNSHLKDGASRYSIVPADGTLGDEREGRQSTKKKRLSMFRSKSAQPTSEATHFKNGADIEFLDRSPADNWSIKDSITHEAPDQPYYAAPAQIRPPAPTSRISLQHVPFAQHHARLSLVAESPSPHPDQRVSSKRTLSMQTENAERRRSQYIQEEDNSQFVNGLPERTNSESEFFAPIRRRSLLQHGVATRKSWVENDPRQSLPSQQNQDEIQNYYYNPAKPTSSPLSNLAVLGPRFEDHSPSRRTMTPNDLDYGHIGAFKLGSLRITNGAASPSSSLDRPATRGDGEDCFVDSRRSANGNGGMGQRSYTTFEPQEVTRPLWVNRAESPVQQSQPHERDKEPLRIHTHLPLPEFSAFNFTTESPTKSLDLANEYLQDLALSPFSFVDSPPQTPRLEATSKHTAVEDDLFEAEPGTPERLKMRAPRSFDSGYHADETQIWKTVKRPQDLASKPLAKADSGYSSNMSLRSFKGNSAPAVPAKEAPPLPPKEPVSRVPSSSYSMTSSYSEISEMTIRPKGSLPALPTGDMPAPFKQASQVLLNQSSVLNPGKMIPAPPLPNKSLEQQRAAVSSRELVVVTPKYARQQSLPAVHQLLKDEFVPGHSPSGSTSSNTSNSTSRWRKDKKHTQSLQPQIQPIYTVQAFRTASEELSIPPVSTEASRHLEERVDGFPVACFPNTFTSSHDLRKTISKETLGTIFSVGSAEYREETNFARLQRALPPVPVHATIREDPTPTPEASKRYKQRASLPTLPVAISQPKHRQSLQAISRKADPSSQQAFENHLTTLEPVSLGTRKSPYEIAPGPMTKIPTAQERAKSMTSQLETEARERFARSRSVSSESFETVHRKTSYDSIVNQNPFTLSSTSLRQTPKSKPPQAHARWSGLGISGSSQTMTASGQQRSNIQLADEGHRFSMQSQGRVRSPPPVSMQVQRKLVPTEAGSQVHIPPSRAPPLPPQVPDRSPFAQTAQFSPSLEQDRWKGLNSYWTRRRKDAGEALRGQKSVEMRRPENTRPSGEYGRGREQGLKNHVSWDASQQQQRWEDVSRSSQYDHTYGSPSFDHNKENWHQHPQQSLSYPYQQYHQIQKQEEYYDGPSSDFQELEQERLPQTIHRRQTSTSEMLVLDRFSGGLNYGYEPGAGLGGSAGTRNTGKLAVGGRKSVGVGLQYGVDFSDVPVFKHRTKVKG